MNQQEKIKRIFSTNPIKGNFCHLYHVEKSDAQFIYDLRMKRGQYLKAIGAGVAEQEKYLEGYLERFKNGEEIYYKMFDPKKNQFCGVTRFTKLQDETNFGFESGVMYEDASPNIYTDAMFMILRMGFEYLERPISGPWTVDVENERMIKLHKLVNIGKVSEITDKYYILYAKQEDYKKNIGKFLNMKFGALGGLL